MSLNDKIVNLKIRANRFDLMRKALWRKRQEIKEEIAKAKTIVQNAPHVEKVLLETKERINRDTIDGYSRFLTSMFHAVFPELQEDKYIKVVMEGTGQRQKLGFYVVDADGNIEDVFQGNGGALTNVISTGLRIISVYRSSALNKVLFLDEQDCWISPDRVSYYYNALNKISEVFDMQIIAISHHDDSLFIETGANLINLSAPKKIDAETEKGWVSGLELTDFRVHKRLRLSFSSGMNVIYGKNNAGKSTVLNALYSVFAGGSDDSVIRHGQDKSVVKVFFANDETVEFTRQKKTPKTYYRVYDREGNLIDEGKDLQDDLSRRYGLGGDADILSQFGMQKEPVFLLNAPGSKMIKSMSIGNETEWVDRILERWRNKARAARSAIRNLDEQYDAIEQVKAEVSSYARTVKKKIKALEKRGKSLAELERQFEKLSGLGKQYGNLAKTMSELEKIKKINVQRESLRSKKQALSENVEKLTALNDIVCNYSMGRQRLQRILTVKNDEIIGNVVNAVPIRYKRVKNILNGLDNAGERLNNIVRFGKEIRTCLESLEKIAKEKSCGEQDIMLIKEEKSVIFKETGGICPCCNQVVN